MQSVELIPAYFWSCEDCGEGNFERCIVFEGTLEDKQALMAELGVDPDEEGDVMSEPDEVTCRRCGTVFETRDFGEDS